MCALVPHGATVVYLRNLKTWKFEPETWNLVKGPSLPTGPTGCVPTGHEAWIGDTNEEGIPICNGSFATGRCKRICISRTQYDSRQWSHTHPYLTADDKWLVFGARRNAHAVRGAKLNQGWLETF